MCLIYFDPQVHGSFDGGVLLYSLPLASKFMQGFPEEANTTWLGIACDLKPKALQPLGALGSQDT